MPIAREGLREIALATLVLGACTAAAVSLVGPTFAFGSWAALPFVVVWAWVVAFFRDPKRTRAFQPGDLCAPADGTVTEQAGQMARDLFRMGGRGGTSTGG